MNRQIWLALCMTTVLIGIAWLTSCQTQPDLSPSEPTPVAQPASLPAPSPRPRSGHPPDSSSAPPEEEIWIIAKASSGDAPVPIMAVDSISFPDSFTEVGDRDKEVMVTAATAARESRAAYRKDDSDSAESGPPADDGALDPASGTMVANLPSEADASIARRVPLPLKHTAVDAWVAGHIGTVNVKQQFANPFDTKIEAVYLFPLPEQAAVTEFLMVIGERTIRGILREKEEAEAIYREARAQGYRASLLVQRRPNIFEQKVANIEPGHAIDIDITYFHTLAYKDGWYSFVFPTVVGPRFNPPGRADPIPAMPRGGNSEAAGATGVEYLAPAERSGHDLAITVRIDAGVAIEDLKSTHEIDIERDGPASATVQLANQTTIPNRDFVLDFRVAGEAVKSNLMTYRDPDTGEGFFSLMVIPPVDTKVIARRPMEMVFVIDCSGSMSGRPLEQAKEAVATALARLDPRDSFQIIRFSDDASQFGAAPVRATERKPGGRTPVSCKPERRGRHQDDRGDQGCPRLPPQPVSLALRIVSDGRLYRQ